MTRSNISSLLKRLLPQTPYHVSQSNTPQTTQVTTHPFSNLASRPRANSSRAPSSAEFMQQNIIIKAAQTNFPIFTRRYSPRRDAMRLGVTNRHIYAHIHTNIIFWPFQPKLSTNLTVYSIKCHYFQKSDVFHFLHHHVPLMCPPPISALTPCRAWRSRIWHQIDTNQSLNIPINQPTPNITPFLPHHSLNSYSIVSTPSISTVHDCIFILIRSYCNIHLNLTVITSTH